MNGPRDHQIEIPSKKRVRRNALKPNSAESDSLREFSILHALDSKMDLDGKSGAEEQKAEDTKESEGSGDEVVSDKKQKVSVLESFADNPTPKSPSISEFPSCADTEELIGESQTYPTPNIEPANGDSGANMIFR